MEPSSPCSPPLRPCPDRSIRDLGRLKVTLKIVLDREFLLNRSQVVRFHVYTLCLSRVCTRVLDDLWDAAGPLKCGAQHDTRTRARIILAYVYACARIIEDRADRGS